ncbi:MAG: VOC family protein [Candidatus Promineifilaceae bacterium]|jgi:glyoxylase I family protein
MANAPATGGFHHISLTVTDLQRSIAFYTTHAGFDLLIEFEPSRALISNGSVLMSLGLPYDPSRALGGDEFNENRVGLDHLSFSVPDLQALEDAAVYFDEQGVEHGEIRDLGEGFGIYVMAFRDPDRIQLELTAPYSS